MTTSAPGGGSIKGNRGDGPGPEIIAATVEGDTVVNNKGEQLGKLESIMIDVGHRQVAYAVLSFGRLPGIENKLFAIPWSALSLDTERKWFVLDVDQELLKRAPAFDKDHWPSMADQEWAASIHAFYNRRPYWKDPII